MDAVALYKSGHLMSAIAELGSELRKQPTNTKFRTFLFELLCFAGEYERAEKQLAVLAGDNELTNNGIMLYRSILHAQRVREEMFERGQLPAEPREVSPPGTINGEAFEMCVDEDGRIGASLEVFMAGTYIWIPFQYIESVELSSPVTLRDLLWTPATLKVTSEFHLQEFGQVHLPVLAPLSWKHPDERVRLGQVSVLEEDDRGNVVPYGRKLLVYGDGDKEKSLSEIRSLTFTYDSERTASAPS